MRISKAMVVNTIIVIINIFFFVNFRGRLAAYFTCESGKTRKREPEIMDQARNNEMELKSEKYMFTCENINDIKLVRKVGKGYAKQVYLGIYNNINVAVKMSTKDVYLAHACILDLDEAGTRTSRLIRVCNAMPSRKLLREIITYKQLRQASLVRMLGFCVRSENIDSEDLENHGIVAVFEYGERFFVQNLVKQPWPERIKYALDVGILLHDFETSPLGSIGMFDFNPNQFVLVNNSIKLTDIDDVSGKERQCIDTPRQGQGTQNGSDPCKFNLRCVAGECVGQNAKMNLEMTNKSFFKKLLRSSAFPRKIRPLLDELQRELDDLMINSRDLVKALQRLKQFSEDSVVLS